MEKTEEIVHCHVLDLHLFIQLVSTAALREHALCPRSILLSPALVENLGLTRCGGRHSNFSVSKRSKVWYEMTC